MTTKKMQNTRRDGSDNRWNIVIFKKNTIIYRSFMKNINLNINNEKKRSVNLLLIINKLMVIL